MPAYEQTGGRAVQGGDWVGQALTGTVSRPRRGNGSRPVRVPGLHRGITLAVGNASNTVTYADGWTSCASMPCLRRRAHLHDAPESCCRRGTAPFAFLRPGESWFWMR